MTIAVRIPLPEVESQSALLARPFSGRSSNELVGDGVRLGNNLNLQLWYEVGIDGSTKNYTSCMQTRIAEMIILHVHASSVFGGNNVASC